MRKETGFTLIELMVTIAVAAIILTVAVPSFRTIIQNNRIAAQVNNLVSGLNLARSEAVKRSIRVSVCPRATPRTSPESCGANWANGWVVFTDDTGTAGTRDGTDAVIAVGEALSGNPTLAADATSVQYRATGSANSAVTFTHTVEDCHGDQQRSISVDATGRVGVVRETCSS